MSFALRVWGGQWQGACIESLSLYIYIYLSLSLCLSLSLSVSLSLSLCLSLSLSICLSLSLYPSLLSCLLSLPGFRLSLSLCHVLYAPCLSLSVTDMFDSWLITYISAQRSFDSLSSQLCLGAPPCLRLYPPFLYDGNEACALRIHGLVRAGCRRSQCSRSSKTNLTAQV